MSIQSKNIGISKNRKFHITIDKERAKTTLKEHIAQPDMRQKGELSSINTIQRNQIAVNKSEAKAAAGKAKREIPTSKQGRIQANLRGQAA